MAKIACLLAEGFEDVEFRIPYEALTEKGFQVDVIGFEAFVQLQGRRGEETVLVDKAIDEVSPQQYDALLIPGGHSPDVLRADDRFLEFVRVFNGLGRPLAALGHGPQLLLSAGLVKGHTLTASKTVQSDLKWAQAQVKDAPMVAEKEWLTARQPVDLRVFSNELSAHLVEQASVT